MPNKATLQVTARQVFTAGLLIGLLVGIAGTAILMTPV